MKKSLLILTLLVGLPIFAQAADVRINVDNVKIQSGNTTITFGDRDRRGYYWDGQPGATRFTGTNITAKVTARGRAKIARRARPKKVIADRFQTPLP